ncbi:MAG: histidine kinase [Deltaproteobacteria bacterium]|nr:histidine kinase [Deltaproteobacteria bacterium]
MATVASIITQRRAAILQRWEEEAKTASAARGLSPFELSNKLSRYLDLLGRWDDPHGERRRQLTNHLSARLREGYRLSDILEELMLLGTCVTLEVTAPGGDESVDASELARLHATLREDAGATIEVVTHYLLDDVQVEKQYLRRLQSLASTALLSSEKEGTLADHLREVLELAMEAVGGQTAAILFHDKEREVLWVAASAGLVEEPLMHYVTDPGSGSFVAEVAARRDETTAVLDAETTEMEVSELLRQSGIHSLLGVRLPARHPLLGVMYIGMTERRPFSLKEVQRLESFGAQLTQHLEQARLHARLKATVEDLRIDQVLRERFISVLAHDLRNPLSVIRSAAHLLDQQADKLGDLRELPGRALRNALRADVMIRDLLDVLRIRAGHELPLTLAECDLLEVARGVCRELADVYGDRFVLQGAAPVRGTWSADALHRALWNLGANAVKYGSPETPIEVTVRCLDEGAEVVVRNQGPVISEADRTTLFEPFAQRGGDEGGAREGWGLGLTLVQSCARAHGGSVAVASAPGEGTAFTIKIPYDSRPFQSGAAAPLRPSERAR